MCVYVYIWCMCVYMCVYVCVGMWVCESHIHTIGRSITTPATKLIKYRKLKNIDNEDYMYDLHKLTILDYTNTNSSANSINTHLKTIIDHHTPIKTIKVHQRCCNPWWTITTAILHRQLRKEEHIYGRKTKIFKIKIIKTA